MCGLPVQEAVASRGAGEPSVNRAGRVQSTLQCSLCLVGPSSPGFVLCERRSDRAVGNSRARDRKIPYLMPFFGRS
ncbi:hypothetical protein NN561_006702 [Cricetulus griseus]